MMPFAEVARTSHAPAGPVRFAQLFSKTPRIASGLSFFVVGALFFAVYIRIGATEIALLAAQIAGAYLLSKVIAFDLLPLDRKIPLLRRPTHWFVAQTGVLSSSVLCAFLSPTPAAYSCLVVYSLLGFYCAAKLGCWNVGCCRARRAIATMPTQLPLFEAALAASSAIAVLVLAARRQNIDAVLFGSVALVAIRIASLILQRRYARQVRRELYITTGLLALLMLVCFGDRSASPILELWRPNS